MEIKDWIVLLIPIFSNGFLIWMFQYLINKRQEHVDRYSKLREEIFRDYLKRVEAAIIIFKEITVAQGRAHDDPTETNLEILGESFTKLKRTILAVVEYFNTYKIVLSTSNEIEKAHKNLYSAFSEWVLSNDPTVYLDFYKNCESLLQNIMDLTLKYIYGID